VFVYIMEALKTPDGAFTPALLLAAGLLVVSALLLTRMKDSRPGVKTPEAVKDAV